MDHNEIYGLHSNHTNATNKTYELNDPEFKATVEKILLAIVLGILDFVTIFGNLLVLFSFVVEKRLLQPFNIYILNLAVTDFLVAITAMTLCTIYTVLGYWPFGIYLCGIWRYFDVAMTFASIFTIAAISADRFWCVTWPVYFRSHNNNIKSGVIIVFIWFCIIAAWTPVFIKDRHSYIAEPYSCNYEPTYNSTVTFLLAVVGNYMPCILMISCYIKVLLVMRGRSPSSDSSKAKNAIHKAKLHKPSPADTRCEIEIIARTAMPSTAGCLRVNKDVASSKTISAVTVVGKSHNKEASSSRNELPYKSQRSSNQVQRDKRIFITLTYVLVSFIICWTPFNIAFGVSTWQPDLIPVWLYSFFYWLAYANSTLNPFIYAYTNKEFRLAFIKVQKMFCLCSTNNGANVI